LGETLLARQIVWH